MESQRQMLAVQEGERKRISRELHDSTGQHLAALGIELGLLEQAADKAREHAERAARAASEAARVAAQAARDAEKAADAAAQNLDRQAEAIPEAARLAREASLAARTAAASSTDASADAAAADAVLAAIKAATPGASRLRELSRTLSQDLHRMAVDLRPTSLDDLGLVAALNAYAEGCAAARAGAQVSIESAGLETVKDSSRRLPFEVETALYRIVQEALTNAAKYAVPEGATRVGVMLQRLNGHALATIEDDGPGFDVEEAARQGRLGLLGMRERASLLGGTLEIESSPGKGTTVYARIPLTPSP
jgi:signal transduction histidine kinase